ncbi:major capsid protein [Halorubrum phage Hardycor1]|nr:major capsid protein [Halorubrum phage Hardycor1]
MNGTQTPTGPASNTPAANLAGGGGFGQFTAQARLAHAKDNGNEGMVANAAEQAATFRANAQLQKDEWKTLDERLVEIAQKELVVVNDMRAAGLTINEDLSTLIHEWQGTNEFSDADVDMAAETSSSEDASTFSLNGTPLPIVHKSFHIPYRHLLASRERGQGLDTQNQAKAARKVMEGLDSLAFNGWGSNVEGYQVYGLRNHPDRNTVTGNDWSDGTNTSYTDIRGDVVSIIESLENAEYAPRGTEAITYFGRGAWQELRRRDTGTDQERSLLERLTEEFADSLDMRLAPTLPSDEVVSFLPVEDVVELAVASDVQNVEWESDDGFMSHMKVMASMTPVVKSDDAGQSGVVHLTGLGT